MRESSAAEAANGNEDIVCRRFPAARRAPPMLG